MGVPQTVNQQMQGPAIAPPMPAPIIPIVPVTMPVQQRSFSTPAVTQPHYRRAADTIVEAPDGVVQIWNGIDKPLRFDASVGVTENVGVLAPASALTMAGTGSGSIVGTFTAYSRFIDRSGNFSSLSPLSNSLVCLVTQASVTNATNASPIVVTSGLSVSAGQIVKIFGVMGNAAANGIWMVGAPSGGTFQLLNGDGTASVGSGVYNSGGTVATGFSQLQYTNVPTPTEAKVVRRQVLRNKDGEASVYYIDIDTTDLTSTTLTSATPSLSLTNPVSLFDDNGETLVDKSLPPTFKKFVAPYLGRMFAIGNEPYAEGAVAVVNGSPNVAGIGTEWGALTFAGRYLTVVGGNKTYTILSATAASLVLTENYSGATDPYANYTISDAPLERRTLYWSEPGQPEAWPVTNSVVLSEDPGAGEFTGLMPFGSWLILLAESRLYTFSFIQNPLLDGYNVIAARRGCVNNRSWVQTEDSAYMLDYRGIHVFMGNDDEAIGSVQVQDLFRPRQAGRYKLNWSAKRNWHAVYDPGENIIRWFVTMSGSYTPRHAICFHVRLQRWWIEHYPFPISASCLGRLNGKPQVFVATDGKRVMALNTSVLDGIDPSTGTVRGTVTSAGPTWIQDTAAGFPTANVAGTSLSIVQGKGKGQSRRITAVSGSQLNVKEPWLDQPNTSSVYQIGGVTWKWVSGWRKWNASEENAVRAVHVQFRSVPNPCGLYLKLYADFSFAGKTWSTSASLADGNGIANLAGDPATDLAIDATKPSGYVYQRLDGLRESWTDAERFNAVELGGTTSADPFSLQAVRIDGVGDKR